MRVCVLILRMLLCKINRCPIIKLSLSRGKETMRRDGATDLFFSLVASASALCAATASADLSSAAHYNFNTERASARACIHSAIFVHWCFVVFFGCIVSERTRDGFLNNGGAHMHKQADWIKSHNNDYLGGNEEECCLLLLLLQYTHSVCFFRAEKQVICECGGGLYFYLWNYFDHKVQ